MIIKPNILRRNKSVNQIWRQIFVIGQAVANNCALQLTLSLASVPTPAALRSLSVLCDFRCQICFGVSLEPIGCKNCHWVGKWCMAAWNGADLNEELCPPCKEPLGLLSPEAKQMRLVRNQYTFLKFRCRFADAGCADIVPINKIRFHEKLCVGYNPLPL